MRTVFAATKNRTLSAVSKKSIKLRSIVIRLALVEVRISFHTSRRDDDKFQFENENRIMNSIRSRHLDPSTKSDVTRVGRISVKTKRLSRCLNTLLRISYLTRKYQET